MSRLQKTILTFREQFREQDVEVGEGEEKPLKWDRITYGRVLESLRTNKFRDSEILRNAKDWVISRIAYGTALQFELGTPESSPEDTAKTDSGVEELQALTTLYGNLRGLIRDLEEEEKTEGEHEKSESLGGDEQHTDG